MRENRPSGSEGGGAETNRLFLPLFRGTLPIFLLAMICLCLRTKCLKTRDSITFIFRYFFCYLA